MVLCFNLAIEILLFSGRPKTPAPMSVLPSFNLAIEILLFSGNARCRPHRTQSDSRKFQSRNRDTSLFRHRFKKELMQLAVTFQSRNRDTSLFRHSSLLPPISGLLCFNLAIEILLFSGGLPQDNVAAGLLDGFNLAIEILLFSGERRIKWGTAAICKGFNLAIEILLFSGWRHSVL